MVRVQTHAVLVQNIHLNYQSSLCHGGSGQGGGGGGGGGLSTVKFHLKYTGS